MTADLDLDGLDGVLLGRAGVAPAALAPVFLLPPAPAGAEAPDESPTSVGVASRPPPPRVVAAPPRDRPAPAAAAPSPARHALTGAVVAGLAGGAVLLLAVGAALAWWSLAEPTATPAPAVVAAHPVEPTPPPASAAVVAPPPPGPDVAAPEAAAAPPPTATPAPVPAPPAGATPAEAPPAPARADRTWTVYFPHASVEPIATAPPAWATDCARLQIVGHTDGSGTPADNALIGLGRAIAARRLFGDDRARVGDDVRGAAATQPIANDDTPDGRRKNRRAEVRCLTP